VNITNQKYNEKLELKEVKLEKFNEKCIRIFKKRKYEKLNTKNSYLGYRNILL
jgi:hypothetical protein